MAPSTRRARGDQFLETINTDFPCGRVLAFPVQATCTSASDLWIWVLLAILPLGRLVGLGLFRHRQRMSWLEPYARSYTRDSRKNSIQRVRQPGTDWRIIILEPVFFPPDMWIKQPSNWPVRTQSTKTYDLKHGEGRRVWEECLERANKLRMEKELTQAGAIAEPSPRYGEEQIVESRLGQGSFRLAVTDAYNRGCAFTGEHSLPALDAAHIKPYAKRGPHLVTNGLLLRADIHRLFEKGYVTVTTKMRIEISPRLREEYQNGRSYYPLHGRELQPPGKTSDYPGKSFLTWHNENVFLP